MSTHRPMEGIRILDLADHTFVPAASAILSDWGAEVIKVEHVDAAATRCAASRQHRHGDLRRRTCTSLLEHAEPRQAAASALDLDAGPRASRSSTSSRRSPTSSSPTRCRACATKLKIDVDDIRAHNPNIIYVSRHGLRRAWSRPPTRGGVRRHLVLVPRHQRRSSAKAPERDHGAGHARARATATPSAR